MREVSSGQEEFERDDGVATEQNSLIPAWCGIGGTLVVPFIGEQRWSLVGPSKYYDMAVAEHARKDY
jgi:hypothetical protein